MTKQFKLRRLAALTAGVLALPASAQAHVTLQPDELPAGGFARLDVRVPNERDNSGTEKIRVRFPDGIFFASYEPAPGWNIKIAREKLDEPAEAGHGEEVTEQVKQVTFTAQNKDAVIAPGEFRDFGLSVSVPDKPNEALTFPALQTYENGEVVRWIGPPDADEPAAQVNLGAAEEEHDAAGGAEEGETEPAAETGAAATGGGEEDDDDGPSEGLVIAALILGGLGLVTGVMALARNRKAAA